MGVIINLRFVFYAFEVEILEALDVVTHGDAGIHYRLLRVIHNYLALSWSEGLYHFTLTRISEVVIIFNSFTLLLLANTVDIIVIRLCQLLFLLLSSARQGHDEALA